MPININRGYLKPVLLLRPFHAFPAEQRTGGCSVRRKERCVMFLLPVTKKCIRFSGNLTHLT
jgi:hypothetical protein